MPTYFGIVHSKMFRTLAITIALAFVVGACGVYAQPAGGTGGNGSNLTLNVAAPSDGATVSIPFAVTIESNVAIGPPESGNHHVHLYFDGATASGDYDIVYSNTVQVTRPLTPGEHTIVASLRNADHSDAGTYTTFTVVVGGGGDGSHPAPAATPPDYGY
jgi:hypothetical protein